jgi:hypothetical protein
VWFYGKMASRACWSVSNSDRFVMQVCMIGAKVVEKEILIKLQETSGYLHRKCLLFINKI